MMLRGANVLLDPILGEVDARLAAGKMAGPRGRGMAQRVMLIQREEVPPFGPIRVTLLLA